VSRRRSPRQRREAARKRKQQARRRELLEQAQAAGPLAGAEMLGQLYGVHARPVPARYGHAVEAVGDGWRVMGSLAEVRAELEHRVKAA